MGMRGSGKSTVGPMLAEKLACAFVDLDDVVAARLGSHSPIEAWQKVGEEQFRAVEAESLRAILTDPTNHVRVVALGGGTPTIPKVQTLLLEAQDRRLAVIVYLRARVDTMRERLKKDAKFPRPALLGEDPIAEVETIFQRRDPLYTRLADRIVSSDDRTPEQVLAELGRVLGAQPLT